MNIEYSDKFYGSSNEAYFIEGLDNTILNGDISPEEVVNSVKGLKNGKLCGTDGISNEMLQLSVPVLANAYIFSHILRNGIYPSMWRENMIKPIYKGGSTMDTNNYRGIAISSCFSKLFCKILFNRLDNCLFFCLVLNDASTLVGH